MDRQSCWCCSADRVVSVRVELADPSTFRLILPDGRAIHLSREIPMWSFCTSSWWVLFCWWMRFEALFKTALGWRGWLLKRWEFLACLRYQETLFIRSFEGIFHLNLVFSCSFVIPCLRDNVLFEAAFPPSHEVSPRTVAQLIRTWVKFPKRSFNLYGLVCTTRRFRSPRLFSWERGVLHYSPFFRNMNNFLSIP